MKKAFILDVEVKITSTSDMFDESIKGAFVFCFCFSESKQDSISKVKTDLAASGIILTRVRKVWPYDGTTWETDSDQKEFDSYADEAADTGQVVFSQFIAYTEDG